VINHETRLLSAWYHAFSAAKNQRESLNDAWRTAAAAAGIQLVLVAAHDDDGHALDFYRAVGGAPSPVTFFTFSGDEA
jgi:hypothetical protein